MKVIVTVGMPGSGKDELIRVAQSIGLATIKMGDLVREEARRRGLPNTHTNLDKVANEEIGRHGPGVWAQRAVAKMSETKMLVDGCRSDQEVTVFRHHFGDLFVLAIFASVETRYQRMVHPQSGGADISLQEFYDRDRMEIKRGIGNAFILADGILVNEGTLEHFRTESREMLERILRMED